MDNLCSTVRVEGQCADKEEARGLPRAEPLVPRGILHHVPTSRPHNGHGSPKNGVVVCLSVRLSGGTLCEI